MGWVACGSRYPLDIEIFFAEVKSQDGGKIFDLHGMLSMVKLFSKRLQSGWF